MAKRKNMKIIISDAVKAQLQPPFQELISRGAEDFDLCEILSKVLALPEAASVIDAFVDAYTPESYKINQLLKNPKERDKVLDLLKSKTFGLSGSVSGNEQNHNL